MRDKQEGQTTVRGPSVVTPGNHDGVHLGHRALVRTAKEHAERNGLRAVALTFDPHPAVVLAPDKVPPLLTTVQRRTELLRAAGADDVVVQPFERSFAALSPQEFTKTALVGQLQARALVVGEDFGFGSQRSGNIETLRTCGSEFGLQVLVVDSVCVDARPVSSSAVREAVAKGDLELAAKLLGRVHEVSGEVVKGCKRGRELGVRTANLHCEPVMQPPDGVYAVAVRQIGPRQSDLLLGVANLGVRPTFDAGRCVEVHVLDFEGDLYGARLRLGFVQRLRDERTFGSADELRAQIQTDTTEARKVLAATQKDRLSWI